jgi:hypothetical protein
MVLTKLLRKCKTAKDEDVLREGVKLLAQELMELEVSEKAGQSGTSAAPSARPTGMGTVRGTGIPA